MCSQLPDVSTNAIDISLYVCDRAERSTAGYTTRGELTPAAAPQVLTCHDTQTKSDDVVETDTETHAVSVREILFVVVRE